MMRDPRQVIADYLATFVGDDHSADHWLPNADVIISWLRDDGWAIAPVKPMAEVVAMINGERYFPHYWSTYCLHEQHHDCRFTCKTCQRPCRCPCHEPAEQESDVT